MFLSPIWTITWAMFGKAVKVHLWANMKSEKRGEKERKPEDGLFYEHFLPLKGVDPSVKVKLCG